MLIFLCSQSELDDGKPMPLTMVNWHSKKLPRICRSSLSAESQALAATIDEMEWCKIFFTCFTDVNIAIDGEDALQKMSMSPVATDAKSLYDATHSITAGMKLSERRTAIEIAIIKQRLQAVLGELFWVNSHQQLADGLTKSAARDAMAVTLARGTHKLSYDPSFIAAKKVTQQEREKEQLEHESCARLLQEEQSYFADLGDGPGRACGVGCALLLRSGRESASARDGEKWEVLQAKRLDTGSAKWLKHAHTLLRRKTCPIEIRFLPSSLAPPVIKVTLYSLRDVLCALPVGTLGGGTGGEASARLGQNQSCRLRPATEDNSFRLRVYRPGLLLDAVLHDGVQVQRGDRLVVMVSEVGEAKVYNEKPRRRPPDNETQETQVTLTDSQGQCAPVSEKGYVTEGLLDADACRAALQLAQRKNSFSSALDFAEESRFDLAEELHEPGLQALGSEVACQTSARAVHSADVQVQSCVLTAAAEVQASNQVCHATAQTEVEVPALPHMKERIRSLGWRSNSETI
eukprot:g11547.t1